MSDSEILDVARQILLRKCMEQAGFDYRVEPPPRIPDDREFPYVIDDAGWAWRHGFGTDLQRARENLRNSDPNQQYFSSLPTGRRVAALQAANGRQPNGMSAKDPSGTVVQRSDRSCQVTAEQELYGDARVWFQARVTRDGLKALRTGAVLADPGFAEAARPWANCMRAAGYPYTTPAELRGHLPPAEKPLPFPEEQHMAVAEANCAVSSGLAATAATLDARHGARLTAKFEADVGTAQRLEQAALPRARELVRAESTGP
jgi:hypothetical protein